MLFRSTSVGVDDGHGDELATSRKVASKVIESKTNRACQERSGYDNTNRSDQG